MPKYVVVCFYTKDTPYVQESEGLEHSCTKFSIHCHRVGYENRGTWVRNAAIKSEFLLAMFEKHPFQDIVYLDADARLRQYPKLFDNFDADIGVHYRKRPGCKELLSGTIYLKNNKRVRALIHAWAIEQQRRPEDWDQRVFAEVIKRQVWDVSIQDLPPQYCQIFDTMKDAGDPVIEHMQASRRFRKLVELGPPQDGMAPIPQVIGKVRIRRAVDGTYYIARRDSKAEAYMDKHCDRLPNELRWLPGFVATNDLNDLTSSFRGEICYIIGKGPSLDSLSCVDIIDSKAPVICLNESIHKVEELELPNPVLCLQQDAKLRDECRPKKAALLISTKAANFYNDYDKAYIFENIRLGLNRNALSVSAAVVIAKRLGTIGFKLVCFDACVTADIGYATCVKHNVTWGGQPERFLSHKGKILHRIGNLPVEWIIPKEV